MFVSVSFINHACTLRCSRHAGRFLPGQATSISSKARLCSGKVAEGEQRAVGSSLEVSECFYAQHVTNSR